jgi:hypothetical protein
MIRNLGIIASLLLAFAASGSKAIATDLKPYPAVTDTTGGKAPAPGESFWVEEQAWVEYMDQQLHQQYFLQARDALQKGNTKAAAEQLSHGMLYMRLEGGRATKDAKPMLKSSELQLKQVVDGLKKGTAPSAGLLDSAYTNANLALARHHYLKAKDNWDDRAAEIVGHDLKAAANELQFAIAWSGQPLSQSTKQATYDIATMGQKMIDGNDYTTDDVDKAIAAIGQQIDAFGKSRK